MSDIKQTLSRHVTDLKNNALAFRALSGLLDGVQDENTIELNELAYLLNPLIEDQKAIIDRIQRICEEVN